MPITVRRAAFAEILPLRHAVLRPGRPLATAHFDGDDAADTIHLAAWLDDAVVGCASLMVRPWRDAPAWQLRGMATRADLVRRGIGAAVLAAAERTPPPLLWCNARLAAVPFYARCGWTVVSEAFDVPDVGPHHEMVRRVPVTPSSPPTPA